MAAIWVAVVAATAVAGPGTGGQASHARQVERPDDARARA